MLNTVYQLKRPRQFEVAFKEMEIDKEQVIVRPTRLSICHADQRYYQGARAEEILRQKLPMALIHEGIGDVVYDPTGTFEVGETVVMIPNRPVEQDDIMRKIICVPVSSVPAVWTDFYRNMSRQCRIVLYTFQRGSIQRWLLTRSL